MSNRSEEWSRRSFLARVSYAGAFCAAAKALPVSAGTGGWMQDSRVSRKVLADRGFASVRQIGDGVYATITNRAKGLETRCNGGFVIGRDAAVCIEGFQTTIGASFQMEALRLVTKLPVRAALNTHFHFDHTLGNSVYGAQGIPVWAHAKTPVRMMELYPRMQSETLSEFLAPFRRRVEEAKNETERAHAQTDVEALTGMYEPVSRTVLALPDHPLDPSHLPVTIDLGGRSVVIEAYIGHTDTDLIFRVPEQNIVYTGDLLVNTQYPTNLNGYPTSWRAVLEKFAGFDKETIFVPGHGDVCGQEAVALLRSVFDDIAGQAKMMYDAGVPASEAAERYRIPAKFQGFRMFSWGFTVGRTITQLYAEWTGSAAPYCDLPGAYCVSPTS